VTYQLRELILFKLSNRGDIYSDISTKRTYPVYKVSNRGDIYSDISTKRTNPVQGKQQGRHL
jgi:hypothetical protein